MKSEFSKDKVSIVWFRRDLRTQDNPALYHACKDTDNVIGLYVLTEQQWDKHQIGSNHRWFFLENLKALKLSLEKLNIPLLVVNAKTFNNTPKTIAALCKKYNVTDIFFNKELEVNERARDKIVISTLQAMGLASHQYQEQTLIEPGSLKAGSGDFYKVYTPFRKAFESTIILHDLTPLPAPQTPKQKNINIPINSAKIPSVNPTCSLQWAPGEANAKKLLNTFIKSKIHNYKKDRDTPSVSGTSQLSPYLAVGAISIRQCFYQALQVSHSQHNSTFEGPNTWINELIWREFYKHLIVGYPKLCKGHNFNSDYRGLPWRQSQKEFSAWCSGETGYPLVDAAMRQLVTTGWMHNRLRMVAAMFLTKHLLIDWRWGEKFFLQHLVDADYAANNGGWQWSASTGADGAPYFRIFNPTRQSERFDPQGEFIKQYLPHLKDLDSKSIHNPPPVLRESIGYPQAIVDHKFAVERAKQTFKTTIEQNKFRMEPAI